MNYRRLLGLAAVGALCLGSAARADVLYWNYATDLGTRLNAEGEEIGDEIVLADAPQGRAYYVTNFSFNYWAANLSPSARLRVRFYRNDGPRYSGHPRMPGSVFFDSGLFPIASTDRSMLVFDSDFGSGLVAPPEFTWTVQFYNLGEGASAGVGGVDLFSPPSVGANYPDCWVRGGEEGWQLAGFEDANVDFAASVSGSTVPSIAFVPDYLAQTMRLEWNAGGFALEYSSQMNGPWLYLSLTSPVTVPIGGGMKYYRLRTPIDYTIVP